MFNRKSRRGSSPQDLKTQLEMIKLQEKASNSFNVIFRPY